MKKIKNLVFRQFILAKRYFQRFTFANRVAALFIIVPTLLALVFFGPVIALEMLAITGGLVVFAHDWITAKADTVCSVLGKSMDMPAKRAAAQAAKAAAVARRAAEKAHRHPRPRY